MWMTLVRDADGLNREANCVDGRKWLDGESEVHWWLHRKSMKKGEKSRFGSDQLGE